MPSKTGTGRDRTAAERQAKGQLVSDARGRRCEVSRITTRVIQKGNGKNRDWKVEASAQFKPKDQGKKRGRWF